MLFRGIYYHHFFSLSQITETMLMAKIKTTNKLKDHIRSLNGIPPKLTPSRLVKKVIGVNMIVNTDIK